jgi:hypothetical protein
MSPEPPMRVETNTHPQPKKDRKTQQKTPKTNRQDAATAN